MNWHDVAKGVVRSTSRLGVVVFVASAAACGDDAVVPGDTEGGTGSTTQDGPAGSSSGDLPGLDSSSDGGEPSSSGGVDDTGSSTGETTGGPMIDPEPAAAGLAAGQGFSCSVQDGVLECWGANGCGQLGDGTRWAKAPVEVAADRAWSFVAAGPGHTCAIDVDGALWCWGDGSHGRVGDGMPDPPLPQSTCRLAPVEIDPGTTWARVAAGFAHTCGVQTDGTMWCWGDNDSGQIGDGAIGPLYERLAPTKVAGDDWIDVFTGGAHSCGLRSDGSVWCWGGGASLDPANVSFSSTPVPIEIPATIRALGHGTLSDHTCAIDVDGRLWCWGSNDDFATGATRDTTSPHQVSIDGAVDEVATSGSSTCARTVEGAVFCFGHGSSGQLGDGVATSGHASAEPLEVPLPGPAVSIAVGLAHACARGDDGVDRCWGDNSAGAIGDGTSGPDNARLTPTPAVPWGGGPVAQGFTAIAVGGAGTCGLRDGSLWCTGTRIHGALGNDDAAAECSLSNASSCIVTTPQPVAAEGTWTDVATGDGHACALASDDTLWCWGAADSGQIGSGTEDALVPVQVGADPDWVAVSAGGSTTCGIRAPGSLFCWGSGFWGQLGDGTTGGSSSTPTQVGTDEDWVDVAVGEGHVCAIRAGGQLACWGRNDFGQLGQGTAGEAIPTPSSVAGEWSAVATSSLHTCAVASDGTIWCWGVNSAGQAGIDPAVTVTSPSPIGADTDWADVALTAATSCGLRTDGTAWCWGSNQGGQIGDGMLDPAPVAEPTMVLVPGVMSSLSGAGGTLCGVAADSTAWCWGTNAGRQGNDTVFVSSTPTEVRDDG